MADIRLDELQKRPELSEAVMALKPGAMRLDDAIEASSIVDLHSGDLDLTALNNIPDKQVEEWKSKGQIGFFEQFGRTKKLEKVPVLGLPVLAYEAGAIMRARERFQKDEYNENTDLKEKDFQTLKSALEYASEEQVRGFTIGGRIAEGMAQLPAYMVEFALSGGIAGAAGRTGAKAMVKQGIKASIARPSSWAIGAAARTATVGLPRVAAGYSQNETNLNLVPTDKGLQLQSQVESAPFSSFTKAFGDTFIEYFSEDAGKLVFNPALERAAAAPFLAQFAKKITDVYSKIPGNKGVSALFTKAGWDGMVSEVGEEVLGDQLRAITGVNDFGKPDGNMLDRMIAAIPNGDELAVMMGVLAVPGASKVVISEGMNAVDLYRANKKAAGMQDKFKTYDQGQANTLAQEILQKNYDVVENTVAEAQQPLPQMELSRQDLEQLKVSTRGEKAGIDESKPVPERTIPADIINSDEFKQADREKQVELLMRGRLAKLDQERTDIEDRMTRLEDEMRQVQRNKSEGGTYFRASRSQSFSSMRGGLVFISSEEVARDYAEGGKYGRKGASVRRIGGKNLRVLDIRKLSKKEQKEILGKSSEYLEDGIPAWDSVEKDVSLIKAALKERGYDALVISEGLGRESLAIMPWAVEKLSFDNGEEIIKGKQQELMNLSKELLSTHAQIADTIDAVPQELEQQQLLLPGESLGQIGKLARQVGARMERSRVENVFRNEKAQAEERRVALVKYLQARIPGPENSALREKYLLRAAKGMTEKKLQEMFKDIEGKRDVVRAKQLRAKANEIVDKFKHTIEDGVKKGRFIDPALQRIADKVLSFVNMSRETAENALRQKIEEITVLVEKGEGESEVAEDLKFEAGLISKVSSLETRNTDQLEDAIQVLTRILNDLKVGRDTTAELRKAQKKAEYAAIASDINTTHATPKTIMQKIASATYKGIVKIYSFNTFHLAEYWRELGGGKANSWIRKLLLDTLERVPAYRAALQQKMTRPMRKAIQDIYGVGQTNNHEFYKFMTARMSIDEKDKNPETAPFIKEVVLNTGAKKNFKMSRFDVMYWYALAHQEEGVIDPEAYEILTGENQLKAIRNQVESQIAEQADDIDVDAKIDERAAAEIKGNAIPADVLDNMFGTLTEKDKKFAMQMRKIFSSFWSLINPVYARATGVDMTRIDSYIPWLRNTSQTKNVEDLLGEMALIEAHVTPFPGSVKERRKTSTAPFAQIGLLEVFQGTQTTMSHWIASRDITARMQGYLKNKAIRTAINQATDGTFDASREEWRDGDYIKAMEFHLKGIVSQGRTDNNIEMPLMRVLRRNLSRYFLIKPRQFLVQLTSMFSAIQKVGHIDFLKGIASYFRDPEGANELMNRAMSLHNRHRNIMVEMKEVQDLLRRDKKKLSDKFNWLDRYGFFFTQAGDRASIGLAGWAVFKKTYDKTKSVEKSYKEMDDFVFNLQQSALREHQTAGTVGPYRYFFQFISAVAQYGRAYHRAFADVIRDPSPKNIKAWARTMVIFHAYIPFMMWFVANLGVPPGDDEDEEEKKLKQLQSMMLTGPFAGLWVLGHISDFTAQAITGHRGFEAGAPVIQQMNKTKDALNKALRDAMDEDADPEELADSIWRAGKASSGLTVGMPAWFNNDVQALYQHTMGEWDATNTPGLLYGHSVEMLNRRNK